MPAFTHPSSLVALMGGTMLCVIFYLGVVATTSRRLSPPSPALSPPPLALPVCPEAWEAEKEDTNWDLPGIAVLVVAPATEEESVRFVELLTSFAASLEPAAFRYSIYVVFPPRPLTCNHLSTVRWAWASIIHDVVPLLALHVPMQFLPSPHIHEESWALNAAAEAAYAHGWEYFYPIRKPYAIALPSDWSSKVVQSLESMRPVGNLGSVTVGEKETVVHRRHLDVFGALYPPLLDANCSARWVRDVYLPLNASGDCGIHLVLGKRALERGTKRVLEEATVYSTN